MGGAPRGHQSITAGRARGELSSLVFVDTNVFMYAVGRPHPLREPAQSALREATGQLATSAAVLQELLHAYLPVGRLDALDRALQLATDLTTIWPVDAEDVRAARH